MSEQQPPWGPQQEPWVRPQPEGAQGTPATPAQGWPAVPPPAPWAGGQAVPPPAPWAGGPVPPPVHPGPLGWTPSAPMGWMSPDYVPPQQVGAVAVDPRRRTRRILLGGGAAAVIAAALVVTVVVQGSEATETSARTGMTNGSSSAGSSAGSAGSGSGSAGSAGSGSSSSGSGSASGPGSSSGTGRGLVPGGAGGFGDGDGRFSGSQGTQASSAPAATASQQTGVVTIDATLKYQSATSAGTGMVISSGGLILTNNHVVDGATAIQVTDESTGRQYTATVVGTDPTADVALLQLKGASGLTTVTQDNDGGVTAGAAVTAIGNAEGTGTLVAATGTVTATDQTMTAQTQTGAQAETLNGLIQFQGAVVSGDSGGPLIEADGAVVGMTTAASSGPGTTVAFAITIENAMAVVHQIESGVASNGVTIGYPAFLGVAFSSQAGLGSAAGTTSGATIGEVLSGTPAASAGMVAGDVITGVNGKSVTSSDALATALATHKPGDHVTITWTSGSTGASSSKVVTLMAGPAN